MASRPPEAPESLIVDQFAGIRNTVSEERLAPADLAAAVNVDLDDAGQARRRRGHALKLPGVCHSLTRVAGRTLVVKDGVLGELYPDYSFRDIVLVGPRPLSYVNVGSTIYFSSETISRKIINGTAQPWGEEVSPGQWLSPVITPTDTLGEISGKLLGLPPTAHDLTHFRGRIYLAAGNLLWATELYLYDLVDKTRNFIQFEDEITMLASVDDGIYVGTTAAVYFLEGTLSEGLRRSHVMDAAAIRGSAVHVPQSRVHPSARRGPVPEDEVPVFMTTRGICAGLKGGEVYNLTQDRMVFPAGYSAAALYREDQGANSYVAVTDSAGSPEANARIGDYVDAQIIRASQGG